MVLRYVRRLLPNWLVIGSHSKMKSERKLTVDMLEDRIVPSTLFVDDDHAQNPNAAYTSIQAAVNAALPGDTVLVYPGTYQEQVTINKSIKLQGLHSDSWHFSGWNDHDNDNDNDNDWSNDGNNNNKDVIIMAPANLGTPTAANPGAIVRVTGSTTFAEIRHFTITGLTGGTKNLLYGVRVDG